MDSSKEINIMPNRPDSVVHFQILTSSFGIEFDSR